MEPRHYHAYIDESGDEGFKNAGKAVAGQGSSEWLFLAGVLVAEEEDLALSGSVDRLRTLLEKPPPRPLHFRRLKHHSEKRAAMDLLSVEQPTFCAVGVLEARDYARTSSHSPEPLQVHRRFLHRTTLMVCGRPRAEAQAQIRNRSTASYADLKRYMDWIVESDPNCSIRRDCIAEFKPVSSTLKLAQVADFYASATAAALTRPVRERRGGLSGTRLRAVLPSPRQALLGHGLKLFPPHSDNRTRYPFLDSL